MSAGGERAALAAVAAGLVAARAAGPDAPAVWLAATALVLAPGWLCVRLLRLERELGRAGSVVAAAALGVALWVPPLVLGFLLSTSLDAVLAVALAVDAGLLVAVVLRRGAPALPPARRGEALAGAAAATLFAYMAWRLQTGVVGDALFHVGRMRKLEEADSLTLGGISSFADSAPHAGYALPALHAAWAAVARLSGAEPAVAFTHLIAPCAAVAIVGAYALAAALTGWRTAGWLAAAVAAWDLMTLLNGLVMQIDQPPPFTFWVLCPAAVVLLVQALRGRRAAGGAAVAVGCAVAVVHVTYVVPLLAVGAGVALGAWLAGRVGERRPDLRLAAWALGAAALAAVTVATWTWWIAVRGGERRPIVSHVDEYVVRGGDRALLMEPWAPVFGRGHVLVAILALGVLARGRRSLPAGGATLVTLALLLVPGVNTALLAAFGMGQFHRFWQLLPWPAALAAAACIAAGTLGRWAWGAVPLVAAASVVARESDAFWRDPASVLVAVGALAGAAGLALAWRRGLLHLPGPRGVEPTVVAVALLAAVMAGPLHHDGDHVYSELEAGPYRGPFEKLTVRVTPGVVDGLRERAGQPPPVVLGDPELVFQLIGFVDVYAQALPEARTRAEPKAHGAERRHDAQAFFSPETTRARREEILRRWDVDYVVLDLRSQPPDVTDAIMADPALRLVYRDPVALPRRLGRFAILAA